jgi:pilus assembly protein Flp/PilA
LSSEQEFWMLQLVSRFLQDESGATAIEYCLIAVGLSIVIITAVNGIGSTLSTKFTAVNSSLK